MQRLPDWAERFSLELERSQTRRFQWGEFDCALFVANCVEALTGVDPAESWRGRYATARGALGALRRHGPGTLPQLAYSIFGMHYENYKQARRGDAVLVTLTDGVVIPALEPAYGFSGACGVVDDSGRRVAIAGPGGLVRLGIDRAPMRFYRVG